MIIILTLAGVFCCLLIFRMGVREGRGEFAEYIRDAYHDYPIQTRNWLIRETQDLPEPYEHQE